MKSKTCFMCGITATPYDYEFYSFYEVKDIYEIHGVKDVCNSFVNYYGHKKPEDLAALKNAMNKGVLVQRKFEQQMNGGYFSEK